MRVQAGVRGWNKLTQINAAGAASPMIAAEPDIHAEAALMARQTRQIVTIARASAALSALAAFVLLGVSLWGATPALADRDSPEFHRGACEGAYPGWLRGVVDGYNGLAQSPVVDATVILIKAHTPTSLTSDDERLGYGDGLMEGFKLGVGYGVELGKAARGPEHNASAMEQSTGQLHAYVQNHCGELIAPLDWDTTLMNPAGTTTVTSLNEAHLAMTLAATANQAAIGAEKMATGAREAEAKGDQAEATKFREAAQFDAQTATTFAQLAQSHAAAGREEAVQAIMDAQAAAEKARKAADNAGG